MPLSRQGFIGLVQPADRILVFEDSRSDWTGDPLRPSILRPGQLLWFDMPATADATTADMAAPVFQIKERRPVSGLRTVAGFDRDFTDIHLMLLSCELWGRSIS